MRFISSSDPHTFGRFATPVMHVWQQTEIGPYTVADVTVEPDTTYAVRVQAKSVDGRYGNFSDTVTTKINARLLKRFKQLAWACSTVQ